MIPLRLMVLVGAAALFGCATIVNDSHIPVSFTFSDGSEGS
jgi:hypothetical protein